MKKFFSELYFHFIEEKKGFLISSENTSELTKQWVKLFSETRNNPKDKLHVVPKLGFTVDWERPPREVYCSRIGDCYYLRSKDYQWMESVNPSEDLPFDKVADIPGVGFVSDDGKNWEMFNENVWYRVKP